MSKGWGVFSLRFAKCKNAKMLHFFSIRTLNWRTAL